MDRLLELIREALDLARSERDGYGSGPVERHLSVAITDLETVEDRVARAQRLSYVVADEMLASRLSDEAHAGMTGRA